MVYVNIINTRGLKLHENFNGMIKSKFRYIIGTLEQVKVAL